MREFEVPVGRASLRAGASGRGAGVIMLHAGVADRLQEIDMPTCVIWGDLDFPHLQARCQQIARTIKGARSFLMAGCAHLPNMEQPARFNQAVSAFLAEAV